MARNIEIKARVAALAELEARVAAVADDGPVHIAQDDTFFHCPAGRLKLRVFADGTGELIFYRRADAVGPRASHYRRVPVAAPDALRLALGEAYGEAGQVRKQRRLYLAGRTRIHLDDVEGLGSFLELEVVLADGEPEAAGEAEARALLERLCVDLSQLEPHAYVDLLTAGPGLAR